MLLKKIRQKRKVIRLVGTVKQSRRTPPPRALMARRISAADHNGLHHVCNPTLQSIYQREAWSAAFVWMEDSSVRLLGQRLSSISIVLFAATYYEGRCRINARHVSVFVE